MPYRSESGYGFGKIKETPRAIHYWSGTVWLNLGTFSYSIALAKIKDLRNNPNIKEPTDLMLVKC